SAFQHGTNNRRTIPPKPLTLCYMLFLNSKAQIASGAEAEQRILGRVIQALTDQPAVNIAAAHPFGEKTDEDASVTFLNLSFEDKSKIWSTLSIPYQVGVFFTVSPVMLDSMRNEPIVRVTDAEFTFTQQKQPQ
ncbi:MAG: Pvc16 family protein, partial [Oscillospiraceae bacterium]